MQEFSLDQNLIFSYIRYTEEKIGREKIPDFPAALISTAKSADLILMVLDATKDDSQKKRLVGLPEIV